MACYNADVLLRNCSLTHNGSYLVHYRDAR